MNTKIVPLFLILQGISILIDAVSKMFNKEIFKYLSYELPSFMNYISLFIGILFLICGIGILLKNKEIYKLSFVVSLLFSIYIIINILLILFMGIEIGVLVINFILLMIYLYITKELRYSIKAF